MFRIATTIAGDPRMAGGFGRIADKGISRAINLVKCSLVLPPRFLSVAVASDRLGIL